MQKGARDGAFSVGAVLEHSTRNGILELISYMLFGLRLTS